MSSFIDGDLVQLKSGGPVMVVRYKQAINEQRDYVYVTWFKPDGTVENNYFNSILLEHFGGDL